MTTPKDVDNLSEKDFEELLKHLQIQPYYVNGKMIPTYAIRRDGLLCGFIGKIAFENWLNKK